MIVAASKVGLEPSIANTDPTYRMRAMKQLDSSDSTLFLK